jgi:hypothetical protein
VGQTGDAGLLFMSGVLISFGRSDVPGEGVVSVIKKSTKTYSIAAGAVKG